ALPPAARPARSVLQCPQQLHLRPRRQFADLVEEQGAAVGLYEFPAVLFGGAGTGTFLVPKQDRLDKRIGEGAAIDGDEGLGAARAAAMNGACDQLFADAR